jgi:hypothetical protein
MITLSTRPHNPPHALVMGLWKTPFLLVCTDHPTTLSWRGLMSGSGDPHETGYEDGSRFFANKYDMFKSPLGLGKSHGMNASRRLPLAIRS